MFYSKTTKGFYDDDVNGAKVPDDAVEVPDEYYRELFDGQSQGLVITPNEYGYPVLVPHPEPTEAELAKTIRGQRDEDLKSSDWTQLPDVPTSLKTTWAVYRQALRDVPQQAGFPRNTQWPTKP